MKLIDLHETESNTLFKFFDKNDWKQSVKKIRGDVKFYTIGNTTLAVKKYNKLTNVGYWDNSKKEGKVYKKNGIPLLDSTVKKMKTVNEAEDMSELQPAEFDELKKKIREGAKDLDQKWANALELVHKAYEVLNIERPTPGMKAGWNQYEDLIQFAVKELADTRGLDADWRMSASLDT